MGGLRYRDGSALLLSLQGHEAVIIADGKPPWPAIPRGDRRCRPIAWIDADLLSSWRDCGLAVRDGHRSKNHWRLLNRPGPRPIVARHGEDVVRAEVRENWMQRLSRDLELEGPLAEAGHRLVADGLRMEAGSYRSGTAPVVIDGRPRDGGAEERRVLFRLDARKRVRDALEGLSHTERRIAEAVCLHDLDLPGTAKALCLCEADAEAYFVRALLKLSRFYGTMPGLRPRGSSSKGSTRQMR